jgi:hypothetical protein
MSMPIPVTRAPSSAAVRDGDAAGPGPYDLKEALWRRKDYYRVQQAARNEASTYYCKAGRFLGLTVVILTTVIGTSAFAALQGDPSTGAKWAVLGLGAAAALAATTKEFMGYGQLSAEEAKFARRYGDFRAKADELLLGLIGDPARDDEILRELVALDAEVTALEPPPVPYRFVKKARRHDDVARQPGDLARL